MTDNPPLASRRRRRGHTLMELITASVSSAMLLAGLGSVMLIANEVANTPAASTDRVAASTAVNSLANDLRYATFLLTRTTHAIEFVVADRDNDGAGERIHYAWSGVRGTPLLKTTNGEAPIVVMDAVQNFELTYNTADDTTSLTTTIESSEGQLLGTSLAPSPNTGITAAYWLARRVDPNLFPLSVGGVNRSDATSWNATRVRFYTRSVINPNAGTVYLQLRSTGSPGDLPTSEVVGQVVVPEAQLPATAGWYNADFAGAARGLALHRKYALVWEGDRFVDGNHAQLVTSGSGAHVAVAEGDVNNVGGAWTATPMEIYFQLYGTYSRPGSIQNVTRTYASRVGIVLQSMPAKPSQQPPDNHSRIEASVPLLNRPELLSAYWRADFDTNPTTIDMTRDGASDWIMAGGGSFNTGTLVDGLWQANGWLESRPKNNFTTITTVEARCRNTSVGGNGAELRIQVDRQGGSHAPIIVRVQRQADGTQTLSLFGKSNNTTEVKLLERKNLSSDFVRYRLTLLPVQNLVNLKINDQDEGTFTYSLYAPSGDDRFLTFSAHTSTAEYDYVELRVAE